jgi:PAS domain S-box-containing protein
VAGGAGADQRFHVTDSPDPRARDVQALASEDSFRLIVETIPGLVAVMTPAGDVEHVNRQVLEYFGRTLDELKQWVSTDAVHPADLPAVKAAWQHAIETGQPTTSSIASAEPTGSTGGSNHAACRCAMPRVTSSAGTTC